MSEKAQDGVVNKWGQTHDISNLFVSDGSQFTTVPQKSDLDDRVSCDPQADYIAEQMGQGTI